MPRSLSVYQLLEKTERQKKRPIVPEIVNSALSARFCHAHFVSVLVQACCHSCPSTYIHRVTHGSHAPRASKNTEHIVCVLPQDSHTSMRNVKRYTSLDYTEHVHSFLIFNAILVTFLTSISQRALTLRFGSSQFCPRRHCSRVFVCCSLVLLCICQPRQSMGRNRKWVLEDNLSEAVWRTKLF